jgi:hypothetical protein
MEAPMAIVQHRPANDNRQNSFERIVTDLEAAIQASIRNSDVPFTDLETLLLRATNEAVRRCLQGRLQSLADALDDEIIVDVHRYRRHQPGRVKYFSLCGAMEVDRWTYRRVDERNGRTIVALDKVAGIVQGATPALAFAVARGVAKMPIRSVEEDLRAAYRCPPSRSKMDRMGRYLGEQVNRAIDKIEPLLRKCEQNPRGAKAINMGLDRTTIPMEEPADLEKQHAKPRIVVRYRMAYVGTFCITDEACEPLVTRRYAVPAHEGPDRLVARMKADLEHALEQDPKLTIGVVQDGAPEMWNLMRGMLDSIPRLARPRQMGKPRHWRETIDRFHLMEKLASALELLLANNEKRRSEIYAGWNTDLNRHDSAIHRIKRWIENETRKATRRVQNEVHRIFGNYFCCPDHFRYATLRRLGLQQGSGVTEGACKSLITMRTKRSGQRWRPTGISAVLAIRSLLDSDRLLAFWPHFSRRFITTIENAA